MPTEANTIGGLAPLLHVVLLHGVPRSAALRECVRALSTVAAATGPSALFVGDAIEKGQTAPDRRQDLSGAPLYLVVTPVAAEGMGANREEAAAVVAQCASRAEAWVLRERFVGIASRAAPAEEPWLQVVMMNVDPAVEDEFNDWYEQEHAARISAAAPEFVSVKRMEAIVGSPRHHAFWRLTDRKAPERDPWLSASETPWTRRIRRFMRDRRRLVMAPLSA